MIDTEAAANQTDPEILFSWITTENTFVTEFYEIARKLDMPKNFSVGVRIETGAGYYSDVDSYEIIEIHPKSSHVLTLYEWIFSITFIAMIILLLILIAARFCRFDWCYGNTRPRRLDNEIDDEEYI